MYFFVFSINLIREFNTIKLIIEFKEILIILNYDFQTSFFYLFLKIVFKKKYLYYAV
jgi:hypothetical protein